jgi:hypothetical protein
VSQPSIPPGGPTITPPDPARELAAARRTARLALALAAVSFAVALLATVLAAVAIGSKDEATATPGAAQPSDAAASAEQDPPSPSDPTGTSARPTTSVRSTGPVEPEAVFELQYQKQVLRVQAPAECGEQRYVDLDEPRVGVERSTAEFGYGDACGVGKPRLFVTSEDAQLSRGVAGGTARDCAEEIRNGPINDDRVLQAGDSYCMVTSPAQADNEGMDRKVVLMTVLELGDSDALAVIEVSAWRVPR